MLEILTVRLPDLDQSKLRLFKQHVYAWPLIGPGYEKYIPPLMSTLVPVTKLDSGEAR